ncbi:MAG TPA: sugar phosphate nucleotidyltransferase, partial [Rhizomicrobium sp.]|nr:sugar phosphate nucleotidyltransferase [Rhizomicrobium sp.]
MSLIYPVILSGGTGSRLWPLSRSLFPKQLLALAGDRSLIQDTVLRAKGAEFAPPLIVCNTEHRFLIAEQMREAGIAPQVIVLEPMGRNTAPAAAIAALILSQSDPEAVMLLMPADHIVQNRAAFLRAVALAAAAAQQDHLVTFGIRPDSPETGYGYIRRGAALKNLGGFAVERFVEKPDAATAASYVAAGDYDWNSGMFAFKARAFLAELERLEPELLGHCREALAKGEKDFDF